MRFGDLGAVRFEGGRHVVIAAGILGAALASIVIVGLVFGTLPDPSPARMRSLPLALAIVAALMLVLAVLWARYWRKLRRAVKHVMAEHPDSFVIGARIPELAEEVIARAGAVPVTPQHVVVEVSIGGFRLLAEERPFSAVIEADWTDVVVAEFVEGDRVYEGVAIFEPGRERVIILQLVRPTPFGASIPQGRKLESVVSEIRERLRSTFPERSPG